MSKIYILAQQIFQVKCQANKNKKNPKLKYKYFGPFKILEVVGKQAYKFKLFTK